MVHGYHVILPNYGFWLPNDPRGSWSEFVRRWELARFGATTKSLERRDVEALSPVEIANRDAMRRSLRYPPVFLNGEQAATVGDGFRKQAAKSKYTLWACAILPEHTHLVLARHTYKIEQVATLLKGAATSELMNRRIHPLAKFARPGQRPPRMWAEHEWKVFLDSEEAIENAIHYVEENPVKEGKPKQNWSFVRPFAGIPDGWITYH